MVVSTVSTKLPCLYNHLNQGSDGGELCESVVDVEAFSNIVEISVSNMCTRDVVVLGKLMGALEPEWRYRCCSSNCHCDQC